MNLTLPDLDFKWFLRIPFRNLTLLLGAEWVTGSADVLFGSSVLLEEFSIPAFANLVTSVSFLGSMLILSSMLSGLDSILSPVATNTSGLCLCDCEELSSSIGCMFGELVSVRYVMLRWAEEQEKASNELLLCLHLLAGRAVCVSDKCLAYFSSRVLVCCLDSDLKFLVKLPENSRGVVFGKACDLQWATTGPLSFKMFP